MFGKIGKFLEGLNKIPALDRLPTDPLVDPLEAISIPQPLRPGEAAFLDIPAKWYRMRAMRRHGGVSVRVAPGVYARGGASLDGDLAPSLISAGKAIVTNQRIWFIGNARSASFPWEEVVHLEEGLDHVKLFREDAETEALLFGRELMNYGNEKLGKLLFRCWKKPPPHPGALPALDRMEQALLSISGASSPSELEAAFAAANDLLEANSDTLAAEGREDIGADFRQAATRRLLELGNQGCVGIDDLNRLWLAFGNEELPPGDDGSREDDDRIMKEQADSLFLEVTRFLMTLPQGVRRQFAELIHQVSMLDPRKRSWVIAFMSVVAALAAAATVLREFGVEDDRAALTEAGVRFASTGSWQDVYRRLYEDSLDSMRRLDDVRAVLEHRDIAISVTLDPTWDPDELPAED